MKCRATGDDETFKRCLSYRKEHFKGGKVVPVQAIIVMLIGVVFIYFGYLIFSGKAPTILDFFLKQGVAYNDKRTLKLFGTIIIIIGVIVTILPFILGIENMNI